MIRKDKRRYAKIRSGLFLLLVWLLAACLPNTPSSSAESQARLPTAAVLLRTPAPPPTSTRTPTPTPTVTPMPTATLVPQPWRFVVLGDTRTSGLKPPDITYTIVEQATRAKPEITLAIGDMINALDTRPEVRQQWQFWREAVAPLAPGQADSRPWLLVTPGNHDVQGPSWATDLLVEAFPELPTNGPTGFERRTYVADYRGVRFISLDSESRDELHLLNDAQLDWLEAQLRDNPNRYTIVFSHDPAYPVGPHAGSSLDAYPKARDRLWQLLRDYKATAYIAGHEHLYNHRQIEGVHQIISGTSGSYIYQGHGGEFYHYVVGEVGANAITFVVYDQQGAERDRFVVPARDAAIMITRPRAVVSNL
jgi:Icc protein